MSLLLLAQDTTTEVIGHGDVFSINVMGMMLIVSLIIPVVNGILFKNATPKWAKEVGLLALSFIGNAIQLSVQADGSAIFSRETLITTFMGWAIATLTYAKFYKQIGLTNNPDNPKGTAMLGANIGV